jgi:hypothetical protein
MEAQPVELYAQRQIGANDFQIIGPQGMLNFEVHAFFPDGQYTSQYILADISSGASPVVSNLTVDPINPDNGYIALSKSDQCLNVDRLRTFQTSSRPQITSNSSSGSPTTLLDNNLYTAWTAKGMDVKTFVKSPLGNSNMTTGPASKKPWLQLDLGASKTVCNIGIAFPNGDKSINFFRVQTSADGQHFTDAGSAESSPLDSGGQLFTFPDMPDKTRYIRISEVGEILSGQTEIAELMAAGK